MSQKPTYMEHKLFSMTALMALGFNEAAKASLQPDTLAEIEQQVRGGAELAIVVRHDGIKLTAWLGLVDGASPAPFEKHLVRVQGLFDAAILPPELVSVTNPGSLN